MQSFRSLFALLVLAWPYFLTAQEVKYIDITNVRLRTELGHPPAPPAECKEGACIGGGSGGVSVGDGAPDQRDPHALGVYLLRVTPTEIRPAEPFEVEFKVTNTGRVPIEVPVNPHLSDLQPSDESLTFSYLSLALVVRGDGGPEGQGQNVPALGFVELYGSDKHDGSIVELRPAEWIRVKATVRLSTWPLERVFARLRGSFWLRRNTFRAQSGGAFTEIHNIYPNETPTPSIPVHLLSPVPTGNPKQ
jgi:hypothetical protein